MTTLYKHIVSSPSSLVVDALVGVSAANPNSTVDKQHKVLYLIEPDRSRVAIISGGGAGHEPAHAGFVGEGMLNAAVCGDIFASPNANQVKRALRLVENDKGTLMVVKSYTGDILNFGLAREQYCAENPSKINSLKFVVVGDDVSVGKKQGEIVGRRGLAGTILVYKIAGALAQQGANLEEVHGVAQFVADRLGTIAVGLEHCHVPGTEPGRTHLKEDEIEVGMGIHNESGHSRIRPIPTLPDLVDKLLRYLFATPESDEDRAFLPWPKKGIARNCVLLVNNLGGLSVLELSSAAKTIAEKISESGVNIERMLVGTYMTSLNMPGFSVTLLLLPQPHEGNVSKEKILELLDAPAKTSAWTWTSGAPPRSDFSVSGAQVGRGTILQKDKIPVSNQFSDSVRRACNALVQAEPEITQMDQIVGDGDCGTTLKAGAEAVLDTLNKAEFASYGVVGSISHIGQIVGDAMGGTSGALYSIYLSALAQGLQNASTDNPSELTRRQYADAAAFALERLYTYTRARPPSRTLIDPLAAFVESLKDPGVHLDQAFEAAQRAAEDTKNLPARAGRAAYVNAEAVKGTCDPGAWGDLLSLAGFAQGNLQVTCTLSLVPHPLHHFPRALSAPSTPSEQFPPSVMSYPNPSVEAAPSASQPSPPSTPARGCLKAPTKEFATRPEPAEPEVQIISPTSGRHTPGENTRRRPNMRLEKLPSNAIARIQLAEGVEPHAQGGKNATSSGARGKCKERVPTPYVKSDKTGWLSDGEE
ncbi:hypothetical protein OPQ81_007657 [Rhizoctonia solani]|nr:hypothetical protein OPQ81_007657 [Rhizoctonia solani]